MAVSQSYVDIEIVTDFEHTEKENVDHLSKLHTANTSQCRLCLRKVSEDYLEPLSEEICSRAETLFDCTFESKDQFICDNCANLTDMLVCFRQAVTVANRLWLKFGVFALESNFWQSPENASAVERCRTMIECHLLELNTITECSVEDVYIEENTSKEFKGFDDSHAVDETNVEEELFDDDSRPSKIQMDDEILDNNEPVSSEEDSKVHIVVVEPMFSYVEIKSDTINVKTETLMKTEKTEAPVENTDYVKPKTESRSFSLPNNDAEKKSITNSPKTMNSNRKTAKDNTLNKQKPNETKAKSKSKNKNKNRKPLTYNQTHVLCDFCGKSIHIMTREHHINQHKGIQPYSCGKGCDRKFYGVLHKQRHEHRMHGGAGGGVKTQECDICGTVIRGGVNDLNIHKQMHSGLEFRCETCGKCYTQRRFLVRHRIVHMDVYKYECQYCAKKFKYKASKDVHEKSVHEKERVNLKKTKCTKYIDLG